MRTVMLTLVIVGLMVGPAWAIHGPKPRYNPPGALSILNRVDGAAEVVVEGQTPFTLEPNESRNLAIYMKENSIQLGVSATLVGTSLSDHKNVQLKSGETTNATITSTSTALTITALRPGEVAFSGLGRESGVVLASSGGLLPLIWIGVLLGRRPRHRKLSGGAPASVNDDPASMLI